MSVKRAFFSIFQKLTLFCCAIFFGFSNAFSANLPSGYTELEYIESTGTQYIDTGLVVKSNTLADFDYQYTNCDGTNYVFGQVSGSGSSIMGYRTTRIWWFKATNLSNACDLNKHTVSFASDGKVYQDGQVLATMGSFSGTQSATIKLFAELNDENVINKGRVKIYNFTFKEGSTIVRNFVPAKNSSGVVGMYDTVSGNFFTNQGTGEFTGGNPVIGSACNNGTGVLAVQQNLYDTAIVRHKGCLAANGTYPYSDTATDYLNVFFYVEPNTSYTYTTTTAGTRDGIFEYNRVFNPDDYNAENQISTDRIIQAGTTSGKYASGTFTTSADAKMVMFYGSNNWPTTPKGLTIYPTNRPIGTVYCDTTYRSNPIKIATTAYNTARFSPVMNDLNSTIATIRDVVTNTINQTKAIADLQAKKQTRPDEQCPAGKKCLLVEDNDGVPHWYEIIENVYGLPVGYTPLEYIQSDGNSWIDTGIKGNMSYKYDIEFQQLDAGQYRNWGAFNQQTYNGGPNMSLTYATGFAVRWTVTGSAEQLVNEMSSLDTNRHHLVIDNGYVTWDGVAKGRSGGHRDNYILSYNLFLGTVNPGGTTPTANAKSKYYSYKVWNGNGDLIQNFVPAKNSSGVIGMYDLVNDVFYTNKGTGTFIGKEF
jgi:hypothetical protein